MPATAPVWKANGTAAEGTGAVNAAWPLGHAAGDFGVLAVKTSNEAIATPAGWTPFGTETGTGTAAAADSVRLALFWRFATSGAESAAALADAGNHTLGVITTFTGVDPGTAIETISAYTTKATNSTSDTFPALTTVGPNRLIVAVIATGQESVKSSPTFAGLASFTARSTGVTTAGVDGGVAVFSGVKATAGSTGTGSVTESITSKAISVTFALRPANFEQTVTPTGIATGQAVGSPTVVRVGYIDLTAGIASAEAVGTPTVTRIAVVTDKIKVVTWTGTGAGQTITTGLDRDGKAILAVIGARNPSPAATRQQMTWYWAAAGDNAAPTFMAYSDTQQADTSLLYFDASGNIVLSATAECNAAGINFFAYVFVEHEGAVDYVAYTGNASNPRNISHALATEPGAMVVFGGSVVKFGHWYYRSLGPTAYICERESSRYLVNAGYWSNTTPTSAVFTIGANKNEAGTPYHAWLFGHGHAINDWVRNGVLVGNASASGPIAAIGWNPAILSVTVGDEAGSTNTRVKHWTDTTRNAVDLAGGEYGTIDGGSTLTNETTLDAYAITGNGFQIVTSDAKYNGSGRNYHYLAFRPAYSQVQPSAIASLEAVGVPTVVIDTNLTIRPSGIESAASFGTPVLSKSVQDVNPTGIASVAAFGSPVVGSYDHTNTFKSVAYTGNGAGAGRVLTGLGLPRSATESGLLIVFNPDTYTDNTALIQLWGYEAGQEEPHQVGASSTINGQFWRLNGDLEIDHAAWNESGTVYYLLFVVGNPKRVIDVFNYVGDGAGTGSAGGRTVTHNLGRVPGQYFVTRNADSGSYQYASYDGGATCRGTSVHDSGASVTTMDFLPTSSEVQVVAGQNVNGITYRVVLIAEDVPGYVKTGSFTGNGSASDGTDVVLGWHPDWLMIRRLNATSFNTVFSQLRNPDFTGNESWAYWDNALYTLRTDADYIALIEGGFEVRYPALGDSIIGQNTHTHAFIAFAELNQSIYPDSISSLEAIGSPTVVGALMIQPAGIASAAAIGSPALSYAQTLNPTGIGSAAAIGSPQVRAHQAVSVTGIASAAAFGTPVVSLPQTVSPGAIASAGAFGSPSVTPGPVTVTPTGVASAAAFGSPTLLRGAVTVAPAGIASAQAFGTPAVQPGPVSVAPSAIASGEVLGAPVVQSGGVVLAPPGIGSSAAFGSPTLLASTVLAPVGLASAAAIGVPSVQPGPVTVSPAGIASAAALGEPALQPGAVQLAVASIAGAAAVGVPVVVVGGVVVSLVGIASQEMPGAPTVARGAVSVQPAGIASSEAVGQPVVGDSPGLREIAPVGIPSAEAFGGLYLITPRRGRVKTALRAPEQPTPAERSPADDALAYRDGTGILPAYRDELTVVVAENES